ncbi:MAG TPA: TetR/AcrR family transcriptional regulator [Candidatus Sulfotelmatobacter sp.]|nr:TetR/AcrR family transcriptional regulator [Candidatus Sulfotelmatobacter sp.]
MTLTRPREAALHEAATRLFRQRGFHATSMQDLAEELGMNRGSLYHYIEAKDDLLWAIVDGAMERLDVAVRPILEGPGPIPERLSHAIAAHLAFAAEHGDELALVQIELRALAPERRLQLVARRDAYEAAWREAIRQGVADGSIRPVDVRLASIAILSVCNWFTQWFRPNGPLDVPAIGQEFAGLFLDGLRVSAR